MTDYDNLHTMITRAGIRFETGENDDGSSHYLEVESTENEDTMLFVFNEYGWLMDVV